MASSHAAGTFESLTLQWSNLADRRLRYYIDLYRSGRWQHYFTEEQFLQRIRDVRAAASQWDDIAVAAARIAEMPAALAGHVPDVMSHEAVRQGILNQAALNQNALTQKVLSRNVMNEEKAA